GVRAIIQPSRSKRDAEVIAMANALGMIMVFTNYRCFKH
ncbi:MAG TPA: bifunctional phosphoribosylaminoimidazolecarboxamide formyltransferase/IMP cyclohydrolase PurH, partial [Atribacterota bacterium]|nr:bifunctional phosphoribosylaminoimidazolecarboxamide formyltransferase/IMP cyclohydrolase PurH [Atribacterota bacterium]